MKKTVKRSMPKSKKISTVKKYQDGGVKNSNKVRTVEIGRTGERLDKSKTRRDGSTVVKTVEVNRSTPGNPTAKKIKTVTNPQGEIVSRKVKEAPSMKASFKIYKESNKIGKNDKDSFNKSSNFTSDYMNRRGKIGELETKPASTISTNYKKGGVIKKATAKKIMVKSKKK